MGANDDTAFGRFSAADLAYVATLRAAGRSMGAISKMMGRNELDVARVAAFMEAPTAVGRKPSAPEDFRLPQGVITTTIKAVAEEYDVTVAEILGQSRSQLTSHARQAAMWRLRAIQNPDGRPRLSLPQIARALRRGDHTTIIHGIKAHLARVAEQAA